jgi:hypothetical protein
MVQNALSSSLNGLEGQLISDAHRNFRTSKQYADAPVPCVSTLIHERREDVESLIKLETPSLLSKRAFCKATAYS